MIQPSPAPAHPAILPPSASSRAVHPGHLSSLRIRSASATHLKALPPGSNRPDQGAGLHRAFTLIATHRGPMSLDGRSCITKSVQTWQGLVTLTRPIKRTPGLGRVLQGPSKASSSLGPPREDTPPLSSPRKALSRPIQALSRSAARPSKVERTEVLLSHIFHSDHHHGLKHLLYPPLTLRPRSRTLPYSHSYPVGRRKLAFYERNAGSAMGSFRMNRALLANCTPIVWRRHLESMRAASIPPRRCSALDEHPAAAKHRSIASTGPLLLGYGAGKEVHILHTRVDEHTPSLFPFSEPPSSHLVLPQPKLRTRARDGSGEESAAKVAQPSAQVTKTRQSSPNAGVLATRRPVPTSLNAETAAARPRQAPAFPIPCGTFTRISIDARCHWYDRIFGSDILQIVVPFKSRSLNLTSYIAGTVSFHRTFISSFLGLGGLERPCKGPEAFQGHSRPAKGSRAWDALVWPCEFEEGAQALDGLVRPWAPSKGLSRPLEGLSAFGDVDADFVLYSVECANPASGRPWFASLVPAPPACGCSLLSRLLGAPFLNLFHALGSSVPISYLFTSRCVGLAPTPLSRPTLDLSARRVLSTLAAAPCMPASDLVFGATIDSQQAFRIVKEACRAARGARHRGAAGRIIPIRAHGVTQGSGVDRRVQFPPSLFLDARPWSVLRSLSRTQEGLAFKHRGAASEPIYTLRPPGVPCTSTLRLFRVGSNVLRALLIRNVSPPRALSAAPPRTFSI
ncbi:hypothetical protein FB451DRAFT_1365585 [Mycena latifolia]|nr:hypothetical protein FB451DRAFT_1365585 [Mycena latifolia]